MTENRFFRPQTDAYDLRRLVKRFFGLLRF
jgi:hypothetical protein